MRNAVADGALSADNAVDDGAVDEAGRCAPINTHAATSLRVGQHAARTQSPRMEGCGTLRKALGCENARPTCVCHAIKLHEH